MSLSNFLDKTAAEMLGLLKLDRIKLLTNNPDKVKQLDAYGIIVTQRLPLHLPSNKYNKKYMKIKKEKTGHLLK